MLLNNEFIKKYGISSQELKILALIFMITDHIGAILLPQIRILRYIGRLSFPIYCFLITEGMVHTGNVYKYFFRLLIFALISEVPFDFAIKGVLLEFDDQNVFFTLAIGLATIYSVKRIGDESKGMIVCVLFMGLAELLNTDYSAYGVIMIYAFYFLRNNLFQMFLVVGITNVLLGMGGSGSQKYAVLAFVPIFLYSGKKKRFEREDDCEMKATDKLVQVGFYAAYPVHLIILGIIKKYIM